MSDASPAASRAVALPSDENGEHLNSSSIAVKSRTNESSGLPRPGGDLIRRREISKTDETTRLPAVTLADLCHSTPREPSWIWHGYLAPGAITLLAGRPKAGKSTLMFGLLGVLATGGQFLGLSARPTAALLLTEEPPVTIREKAVRFGIAESRSIEVVSRQHARGLGWHEIVAAAADRCRATSAELLVVDTLNRWVGLPEDAENKAGAMMASVEPLLAAADRGIAVLALVHQRKSPGTHGEALRGSNALPGSVEIVVELERLGGGGPLRALYADSRFQDATPAKLLLELQESGYTARDSQEVRTSEDRATILEVLTRSGKPMSVDELVEATRLRKQHVYGLLNDWAEVDCCGGTGRRGSPRVYRPAAPVVTQAA